MSELYYQDPVLEQILDELRDSEWRARTCADWLDNPPFRDDDQARQNLRADLARRAAFAVGKLQAIDQLTAETSSISDEVPF